MSKKKASRRTLHIRSEGSSSSFKHCDDYIDDESAPASLRVFLAFARSPAHGLLQPTPHPRLFADYKGTRVRVTMASRLGVVGITPDLDREEGYAMRASVAELNNFSDEA